jgi:uncharacterized membrane-anchored protein YhcB (DUF1043 family)
MMKRTGVIIKKKFGKAHYIQDDEYKQMKVQCKKLEKSTRKFFAHSAELITHVAYATQQLNNMADDFETMYGIHDEGAKTQKNKFEEMAKEIEKNASAPFQKMMNERVQTKIHEYNTRFDGFKKMHQERRRLMLDYIYHRDKVSALMAKENIKNPDKLPNARQKLQVAEEAFNKSNDECKKIMRAVLDRKLPVMEELIGDIKISLNTYSREMNGVIMRHSSDVPLTDPSQSFFKSVFKPAERELPAPGAVTAGVTYNPTEVVFFKSKDASIPSKYELDWYYLDLNMKQIGPVDFKELSNRYKTGRITDETHVFNATLVNWLKLGTDGELRETLICL